MSVTASASSRAVTVIVWAAFQLEMVNVSVLLALRPDRLRSVPFCPLIATVTVAVGSLDSLTV